MMHTRCSQQIRDTCHVNIALQLHRRYTGQGLSMTHFLQWTSHTEKIKHHRQRNITECEEVRCRQTRHTQDTFDTKSGMTVVAEHTIFHSVMADTCSWRSIRPQKSPLTMLIIGMQGEVTQVLNRNLRRSEPRTHQLIQ